MCCSGTDPVRIDLIVPRVLSLYSMGLCYECDVSEIARRGVPLRDLGFLLD